MVGWHHRLNGHEFEQTKGVGDGQGGLACCNPWGCKESDTTERLNCTELTTAEFSKFAGISSAALLQHHLLGFEVAQLEFPHLH